MTVFSKSRRRVSDLGVGSRVGVRGRGGVGWGVSGGARSAGGDSPAQTAARVTRAAMLGEPDAPAPIVHRALAPG